METKYNRIGEVLDQKGMTAYWLAGVLNVSNAAVSQWVNQQRQPPLSVLFEAARALNVEAKTLLVSVSEVEKQEPRRFQEIKDLAKKPKRGRGRISKDLMKQYLIQEKMKVLEKTMKTITCAYVQDNYEFTTENDAAYFFRELESALNGTEFYQKSTTSSTRYFNFVEFVEQFNVTFNNGVLYNGFGQLPVEDYLRLDNDGFVELTDFEIYDLSKEFFESAGSYDDSNLVYEDFVSYFTGDGAEEPTLLMEGEEGRFLDL